MHGDQEALDYIASLEAAVKDHNHLIWMLVKKFCNGLAVINIDDMAAFDHERCVLVREDDKNAVIFMARESVEA